MTEPTPEEVKVICDYTNTVDPDSALEWLRDNDCFAELVWLDKLAEAAARSFNVSIMVALANARGELNTIKLDVPVEDGYE